MKIDTKIQSVLKLEDIIVNEIQFNRSIKDVHNSDLSIKIESEVLSIRDGKELYKVDLKIIIEESNDKLFKLLVSISGFFTFDTDNETDDDMKKVLLKKNTLAILFPYLRSQVKLLTVPVT